MKKIFLVLILLGISFQFAQAQNTSIEPETFFVVELFTSEGCSSCPSRDDFLNQLIQDQNLADKNFVAIAEHVTYWDYLGWQDPFGKTLFNSRQYAYTAKFGSGNYTPMYVINGLKATSNSSVLSNDLANAFTNTPTVGVQVEVASDPHQNNVTINYEVVGAPANSAIAVVLVETNLSTDVPAGENAGKNLKHENVARDFRTKTLSSNTGSLTILVSSSVIPYHCKVLAFVYNTNTLEVIGGTKGVRLIPTSIEKNNIKSVSTYPNPVQEILSIYNPTQNLKIEYELIDFNGKLVQQGKTQSNITQINMQSVNDGIYFLKLIQANEINVIKVVKF